MLSTAAEHRRHHQHRAERFRHRSTGGRQPDSAEQRVCAGSPRERDQAPQGIAVSPPSWTAAASSRGVLVSGFPSTYGCSVQHVQAFGGAVIRSRILPFGTPAKRQP